MFLGHWTLLAFTPDRTFRYASAAHQASLVEECSCLRDKVEPKYTNDEIKEASRCTVEAHQKGPVRYLQ